MVRSYPLYFWELVAGPTTYLQLPLFNRQVLCGMFIDYLSSDFICSSDKPDEEADSNERDVHEQVLLPPGEHIPALCKQEQHMDMPPDAKSHDKNLNLKLLLMLVSFS